MNRTNPILKGTLILTLSGLTARLIGFFYRIFLSNLIGAEQLGIYQMIFPILMLLFSFTSAGSQLVISRRVAAGLTEAKKSMQDKYQHRTPGTHPMQILCVGLAISLLLSIPSMLLLYYKSEWLAMHLLSEPRCAPLLKIAAWAIPLSAVHMCIEGYYYGQQKSSVTAFTNLMEQLVRVLSVWLLYRIAVQEGRPVTVSIAVCGLVLGEAASALISLTALSFQKRVRHTSIFRKSPAAFSAYGHSLAALLASFARQGIPLTANRVLLNLLQSIEAILLPASLQLSGLTSAESLSIYGVLTGMAMPFILFPSTLTNSASAMLMPSVAKAQASDNTVSLKHTTAATFQYTLMLGIFCTGIFVAFGQSIGNAFFHNALAGKFLQILGWICPLMYISATFTSILHGLGKTTTVFTVNLIVMLLRILFVLFAVPHFGILGFLWGMLFCHLLLAALYWMLLYRLLSFPFDAVTALVKPVLGMLAACLCGRLVQIYLLPDSLPGIVMVVGICGILYGGALILLGLIRLPMPSAGIFHVFHS